MNILDADRICSDDPLRRLLADTLVIYGASKVNDLDGWPREFLELIDGQRTMESLGYTMEDEIPRIVEAAWYKEAESGEDTREERSAKISSKWDAIPTCMSTEQAEAVARSVTGIKAKGQKL